MNANNEPSPGFTPQHLVGHWQIYQDSEITGDERCRNIFKVSLSLPQAKFAFINSQSLDQMSVGQAKDTDGEPREPARSTQLHGLLTSRASLIHLTAGCPHRHVHVGV